MKGLRAAALLAVMALSPAVLAGEAGDAVFADRGPWALPEAGLRWAVTLEGPGEAPGFVPITDGSLALAQITDVSDGQPVLQMTQKTDNRTRQIGPFPVSGGDPVLTFFLEQVTRDMAKLTGGSPYYIRNRLKDALFRGGRVARSEGVFTAEFQPFASDPNTDRMQGFGTLYLRFAMGDPKAPIRDLLAETEGEDPGYRLHLVLQ